jgi:hypothetical protein
MAELTMAEVSRRPASVSSGKALRVLAGVGGGDRLRVFRADMGEDGSFDAAVAGCVALFHVAASMDLHVSPGHDNNVGESRLLSVLRGPTLFGGYGAIFIDGKNHFVRLKCCYLVVRLH